MDVEDFELVGGRPCLDFANNRESLLAVEPPYDGLLALSLASGTLSGEVAARLRRHAERRPGSAAEVVDRADRLAVALRRSFTAVARGEPPPPKAVATLNEEISAALGKARLRVDGAGSAGWTWRREPLRLDRPLWPVVRDAADLLTADGADRPRIDTCDGRGCDWLFVDASRNRSRRWCDMAVCGNRAKVRRYRRRHRG